MPGMPFWQFYLQMLAFLKKRQFFAKFFAGACRGMPACPGMAGLPAACQKHASQKLAGACRHASSMPEACRGMPACPGMSGMPEACQKHAGSMPEACRGMPAGPGMPGMPEACQKHAGSMPGHAGACRGMPACPGHAAGACRRGMPSMPGHAGPACRGMPGMPEACAGTPGHSPGLDDRGKSELSTRPGLPGRWCPFLGSSILKPLDLNLFDDCFDDRLDDRFDL